MSADVRVVDADWQHDADREAMVAIRQAVFVVEQRVPRELELDGSDEGCRHLLALAPDGAPIGTARMRDDGHIGRIAVVADWRGRGVGARLVGAWIERARRTGLAEVDLDSQTHAVPFYEKLGFEARGDEFMDAGIPHRNMRRLLG